LIDDLFQDPDGHRRNRGRFPSAWDDRQPGPRQRQHHRRRPRRRDADLHTQSARPRGSPDFFPDAPRIAQQPIEPADVDRDKIVAMALVAWRKVAGQCDERARIDRRPFSGWRSIEACE